MDSRAIEEQYDEFLQHYKEYLKLDHDIDDAFLKLQKYPLFDLIRTEDSDVYIPRMDALAEAIVEATWSIEHERVDELYDICHISLLMKVLQVYLRKTLASNPHCLTNQTDGLLQLWQLVLHYMRKLSRHKSLADIIFPDVKKEERDCITHLASVCTNERVFPFIMILAVMTEDWDLVIHYLQTFTGQFKFDPWLHVWFSLCDRVPWNVREHVLRSLFMTVATETCFVNFRPLEKPSLLNLARKYQNQNRVKWMIMFYVLAGEWQTVQNKMKMCRDNEIINFVLLQATDALDSYLSSLQGGGGNQAAIVESQTSCRHLIQDVLPRCSNTSVLWTVFKTAVFTDFTDVTITILQNLGLQSHEELFISDFLECILYYIYNKDVVDALLKLCAKLGMSTRCNQASTVLARALPIHDSYTIKALLLEIGFVSYAEYFQCIQPSVTTADDPSGHVLREMVNEGTRQLAEQCRLVICHAIGFQHGRADRINRLSLPNPLKSLVAFEDMK